MLFRSRIDRYKASVNLASPLLHTSRQLHYKRVLLSMLFRSRIDRYKASATPQNARQQFYIRPRQGGAAVYGHP